MLIDGVDRRVRGRQKKKRKEKVERRSPFVAKCGWKKIAQKEVGGPDIEIHNTHTQHKRTAQSDRWHISTTHSFPFVYSFSFLQSFPFSAPPTDVSIDPDAHTQQVCFFKTPFASFSCLPSLYLSPLLKWEAGPLSFVFNSCGIRTIKI